MRNVFIYSLIVIATMFMTGCNRADEKKVDLADSIEVVEKSLQLTLDKNMLPKEYYQQRLQVVTPKGMANVSINVNGMKCLMLPEKTDVNKLLRHMDIFDPIPLVEIIDIKFRGDIISVELIFRATGHNITLNFKRTGDEELELIEISEGTI